MNRKISNLVGLMFGGFLLMHNSPASAEKSYWRLNQTADVNVIIETSWVFPAMVAEFHPSYFYVYDNDDGSLGRYSAARPLQAPPKMLIPHEDVGNYTLEARIIGDGLRLLLSDGRKNIAFLTLSPLKNEDAFRTALAEEHDFIDNEIEKAVRSHPPITFEPEDASDWSRVNLDQKVSLQLPADRFYIHRTRDGEWQLYDMASPTDPNAMTRTQPAALLTLRRTPVKDASHHSLYENEGVTITTNVRFDPFERKTETGAYQLSRQIPLDNDTLYLQSARLNTLDAIPMLAAIARSVKTTPSTDGITTIAYLSDSPDARDDRVMALGNNLEAHLPDGYALEDFGCNQWSDYEFTLTKDMSFSCDTPATHYIKVEDSKAEGKHRFDRPHGGLYLRRGRQLVYDQNEATAGGWSTIVLEDSDGFVYYQGLEYQFIRHFKVDDIHMIYYMNFNDDMAGCLREFQRSTNAIQAAESE